MADLCQRELHKVFLAHLLAQRRRCGNARVWRLLSSGVLQFVRLQMVPLSGHRNLRIFDTSLPPLPSTGVHKAGVQKMNEFKEALG